MHIIIKGQGLISFLSVCKGMGGGGVKNVRKTYEEKGDLLETYDGVQVGGRRGSKIAKCERIYFFNDPTCYLRHLTTHSDPFF